MSTVFTAQKFHKILDKAHWVCLLSFMLEDKDINLETDIWDLNLSSTSGQVTQFLSKNSSLLMGDTTAWRDSQKLCAYTQQIIHTMVWVNYSLWFEQWKVGAGNFLWWTIAESISTLMSGVPVSSGFNIRNRGLRQKFDEHDFSVESSVVSIWPSDLQRSLASVKIGSFLSLRYPTGCAQCRVFIHALNHLGCSKVLCKGLSI